jgi:hypothetical protein
LQLTCNCGFELRVRIWLVIGSTTTTTKQRPPVASRVLACNSGHSSCGSVAGLQLTKIQLQVECWLGTRGNLQLQKKPRPVAKIEAWHATNKKPPSCESKWLTCNCCLELQVSVRLATWSTTNYKKKALNCESKVDLQLRTLEF